MSYIGPGTEWLDWWLPAALPPPSLLFGRRSLKPGLVPGFFLSGPPGQISIMTDGENVIGSSSSSANPSTCKA
ncbi:MAG TPA: hypothetical protein VH328_16765, partial [Burkholderiaceae bacterium]|nr:hypothetical protein [Burkholderiaceae bacterium]